MSHELSNATFQWKRQSNTKLIRKYRAYWKQFQMNWKCRILCAIFVILNIFYDFLKWFLSCQNITFRKLKRFFPAIVLCYRQTTVLASGITKLKLNFQTSTSFQFHNKIIDIEFPEAFYLEDTQRIQKKKKLCVWFFFHFTRSQENKNAINSQLIVTL